MTSGWEGLQARVQATIDGLVASGRETGVQVCAYRHGEVIVDACAGTAGAATGRPVTPDTPFFSYSTARGSPRPWCTPWPSGACSTSTCASPRCGRGSPATARTR